MIDKLTDFIIKYLPYTDRETIKEFILTHAKYKTLDYCSDDKGIVAVVRYNIEDDTGNILDFAVREDYRNKHIGGNFLLRALSKWNVKRLKFKRTKVGEKEFIIPIKRLLNSKI